MILRSVSRDNANFCSENTNRAAVCMSPTWPDQPSPAQNMVPTMALYQGTTLRYWGWTAQKHENDGNLHAVHVGKLIDAGMSPMCITYA